MGVTLIISKKKEKDLLFSILRVWNMYFLSRFMMSGKKMCLNRGSQQDLYKDSINMYYIN